MKQERSSMRVVVTGATGFIGSYLVKHILAQGGEVAAIVRKNSPNLSRLPNDSKLTIIGADLDDVAEWSKKLADFKPQIFYHLAWKGVGNKERNDFKQVENIKLSLDTLKAAKELGCVKWIGAGSQAEYGTLHCRIAETDPTQPTTLYGEAKLATCRMSRLVGEQLGLDVVWVRIFSTYGVGDNEGWLLPDVIKKLLGREKPMLTLGEQLWDYLQVVDAAEAFWLLGITEKVTGIYNLGSGKSQTIRSVVELVRDLIDPELELGFGEVAYRPDQVMYLEANIEKLTRDSGWRPKTDIATGVAELIRYLRSVVQGGEK
ncbi:NAD(P)-dependent oxidoreductase [Azotosporobacter soli]|uniref:NAD-dependent epimerase/dehydratase family protein n=1 Tax=Azotosporobacter soli TaxID=3055040 RepID=UPI0031FEBAE5